MSRFTRWHYTDDDPEGITLLAELRQSEDWSAKEIWNAVLLLAEREAQYTYRPSAKRGWLRRGARRWIFHGGKDFEAVCHMAGWHPDFFRERVRGILGDE